MTAYSSGDVADRAGVANDYVVMLVDLGILSSGPDGHFSEGDVRRVRQMQTLERAGMPLQGVAAAVQRGNLSLGFLATTAYDRLASLSDVTFHEVSEKTGIPVELLMVIRDAVGFAEPQPEDRLRENELQIVALVEAQISEGFHLTVIERWLRTYGDSLRRIAETEVEATLSEAGVYSRLERPPAICFLDITAYTRLTEERGDEAAAELAGTLSRMVRRSSRSYGGKPVKWLGDGVMFFFPDPGSGVLAALDMVEGAANVGLPPAHVGLHAGPVLFQEGDYFGRTVNVAARIAEYARPGEVVVSQDVVEVVTTRRDT